KTRPKLTLLIFCEIFISGFLGVIGALLIVTGLYSVLWGKSKEMEQTTKTPKLDSGGEDTGPESVNRDAEMKDIKPSFQSKNMPPALLTDNRSTTIAETTMTDCSTINIVTL
ncbi:hypothetical protein KI387_016582, partial [Taxus chinensis]